MKKWLFLVCGAIEFTGALLIYFNSEQLYNNISANMVESRLYAITMLSLSIVCFICFHHFSKQQKVFDHIYLVLMFFNAAVSIMTYNTPLAEFELAKQATWTHGALFILLVIGYLNDVPKYSEQ